MIKILYLLLFLAFPLQADATEVFGNDSFQLAKSVKLGRSSEALTTDSWDVSRSSGGNNIIPGGGGGRKLCNISNCASCNMGTGLCDRCEDRYGKGSDGKCYTCGVNCQKCTFDKQNERSCEICDSGYTRETDSVTGSGPFYCQKICSPGYFGSNGACRRCEAGTYSAAGASSCTKCSAGYYSVAGASSCSSCMSGTYSDVAGASACKKCPVGTYFPTIPKGAATACLPCDAGYYCPSEGMTYPIACPNGKLPNTNGEGATSCVSCDDNLGHSLGSPGTCTKCEYGYGYFKSSSSGTLTLGAFCLTTSCDPGYHSSTTGPYYDQPSTSGTAHSFAICQPCGGGKYKPAGATSCMTCPDGSYCAGTATVEPTPCKAGSFCPAGTAYPKQCPAGTFAGVGQRACTDCPSGTYALAGASSCTPCSSISVGTGKTCTSCEQDRAFCTGSNSTSSGNTSSTSCSGDKVYRTGVKLCPLSDYTAQNGCFYSDVGQSCSSSSQCKSGMCAPCNTSIGSTCR